MQTPELVEFMRSESAKGQSREAIAAALLKEGWALEDIEGAIGGAPPQPPSLGSPSATPPPKAPSSSWWGIVIVNKVSFWIYLALLLIVDLVIVIRTPELFPFWFIMVGVFVVFLLFYSFENSYCARRFLETSSRLDIFIGLVIGLRNVAFLLNFIPVIQLLGLAIIAAPLSFGMLGATFGRVGVSGMGGWYLLAAACWLLFAMLYIILMIIRFKASKRIAAMN